MKISIALCTYNGEKYLKEQLKTIANQTLLPDELVACDDLSKDNTLEILNSFKRNAPFKVRIYRNKINLGHTKNFEKAINLCEKDIIFTSDQDDAWMSYKVELLHNTLLESNADYAFSNLLVVDENLSNLGYTMWDSVGFTRRRQIKFKKGKQVEVLLKGNVVTGSAMVFKAKLKDLIIPIPDNWVHDAWIALLLSACENAGFFVEKPLVKYRQHSNQLIGGRKTAFNDAFRKTCAGGSKQQEEYIKESRMFIQLLDELNKKCGRSSTESKTFIEGKIKHLKYRSSLYSKNINFRERLKIMLLGCFTGRYHKYSNGFKSVVKDLFIAG